MSIARETEARELDRATSLRGVETPLRESVRGRFSIAMVDDRTAG